MLVGEGVQYFGPVHVKRLPEDEEGDVPSAWHDDLKE